jgi:outer membrane protein TolC
MRPDIKLSINIILALVFITATTISRANHQSESEALTLHGFLGEALAKNPGLQSKKKEYDAARARVIKSWLPEDPMIGIDVEGQREFFDTGSNTDKEYMVSQTIPFPTKLILGGIAASKEADIAYQRYKEKERELIWHVEEPYYELFMIKKTLIVLNENQILLDQILNSVKARYESNQVTQDEFLKAQIELSRNGIEIFNMKEKERLAQAHFAHIVNEPLHTNYQIVEEERRSALLYSRDELEQIALKKRPELKAMELGLQKAGVNQTLAYTEWLPDITGRLEARQYPGESGLREHDNFIGVSVPVWSLLKGVGGGWKSASDDVKAADAAYQDMKNEVRLKVHEAYSKAISADNAIKVYENFILPQAKQQVQVALSSYSAGKSPFLSLIDAQRTLKTTQMEYYKAIADYEMGLADLRMAVGDDLKDPIKGDSNDKK